MRSLLFVPGDSPRKLERAASFGADALILDLEDSVAPAAKEAARAIVLAALRRAPRRPGAPRLIVRVNALDSGLTDADLDAVMVGAPDMIMLPKARSGVDVGHLGAKLAVHEAQSGLADGATRIIAIATETAGSLFALGTYAGSSPRLAGLTWGAEDLSADIGAEGNRDEAGAYTPPFALARNLMLFGAAAAEVPAIDTVSTDFRNVAALRAECEAARRDGFTAKMAVHPAQVPIINEVFTPTAEAVARAGAIVATFAADPNLGVVGIDGEMIDRPHLRRAQRLLERAAPPPLSSRDG